MTFRLWRCFLPHQLFYIVHSINMIPQQPEKGLHLGIILCADGRTPENDGRIETNAPHFYLYTISSLQDKCGIVSNFVPFSRITWNYKCH